MAAPRLAIITTHPIQYYAPVFRQLVVDGVVEPRVFYTWSQSASGDLFDPGFGKRFSWDIPLLDGYDHEFVPNVARRPGVGFFGIRTPTLVPRIEAWGADAVLVYGWNNASHLGAMRHFKARRPVFFRGDSTLLDPVSAHRRALRRLVLRWVYRHIDVALAVGQNSRDYFRHAGVPDHRIAIAPHSVDTERFALGGADAQARAEGLRTELSIPADAMVVLFAGKFVPKKSPELLLNEVLRIGGAVHLVLVGNGEREDRLRRLSQGKPFVHFVPFQNQGAMPSVYRLGDLFVLPSAGPGETWGLALNEAMACGRAVMASDRVGGARDLITNGKTGWIFAAGQPESLRAALLDAVGMGRAGLAVLGAQAQQRVVNWSTAEAARCIGAAVAAGTAGR